MPRIIYEPKKFGAAARQMIGVVTVILDDYAEQGYDLTLRQLYYQMVARDLFPDDRTWTYDLVRKRWYRDPNGTKNAEPNYKWLGSLVNDARLAGYVDWERIVDRTRSVRGIAHWESPAEIIEATARSFRVDLWEDQPNYVEVWIEKDALVGVITDVCSDLDVPYFSCRGYTSQSEMWVASRRLLKRRLDGKAVTVLHLGDHDPSGIDMTRDIEERLRTFVGLDYVRETAKRQGLDVHAQSDEARQFIDAAYQEAISAGALTVERIALNMDQVEQYDPPPNPAKTTDSRYQGYIELHGYESWELDALEPAVLSALVRDNVEALIDDDAWDTASERQSAGQRLLQQASQEWDRIAADLNGGSG